MTSLIDRLYDTRQTVDDAGQVIPLTAEISRKEGRLIFDLIAADPAIKKTLEVGCAFGLSSLHICEALRGRAGAQHTILDPFQMDYGKGAGIRHLQQAGIDFFRWLAEKSEYALPRLAQEQAGTFDFIFIDGVHTFDHTLLDAFYSLRLLRPGGLLVLDDTDFDGVDKVVSYLRLYPCLQIQATIPCVPVKSWRGWLRDLLGLPFFHFLSRPFFGDRYKKRHSMVVFKKIAEDDRAWDWYQPF